MCGIFGFASDGRHGPDIKRLEKIALATETRGPHAFGFAWIDGRGRLKMFKQQGRIRDRLACLRWLADARMVVGHCRFATHGDPADNANNHPHPCDGGWLVHNGVIRGYREIVEGYLLAPQTECDSEVLALLIEDLDGTLIERCQRAAAICEGGALAMAALWRNPQRLIVLRAGNPLSIGEGAEGTYFGSLPACVPAERRLPDDSGVSFSFRAGRLHAQRFTVPSEVLF